MDQQSYVFKEIRTHGTQSFPCAAYRTHTVGKGPLVKHHWHDEAEILYFSGNGKFRLEINMESFPIRSECFCFINPGELHSIIAEDADSHWEDAVVFSPGLLSFDSYDEAQIHLVKPIQNGKLLFPRCITPQHAAFAALKNAFGEIMNAFGQMTEDSASDRTLVTDDLTSQLYIKASLLYILATLSAHRLFIPAERNFNKRVESVKTALSYIKDNYHDRIYISDLAKQVNLNEQYFCRLFKKAIGCSPVSYINDYRVKQAKRLLEKTDLPVTDICLECGYHNLGNFLREFRRHTGTTPLQYRKHADAIMS
ncbi:MAG: AraC family transcriptional regulator [Lachnospiraceae bacterium]|nr:AraC family transcriptional regulator [Lachnospiraceae bacterium]